MKLNRVDSEVILCTVSSSMGKTSSHQLLLSGKRLQTSEMSVGEVGIWVEEIAVGVSLSVFLLALNFISHSPCEISVSIH